MGFIPNETYRRPADSGRVAVGRRPLHRRMADGLGDDVKLIEIDKEHDCPVGRWENNCNGYKGECLQCGADAQLDSCEKELAELFAKLRTYHCNEGPNCYHLLEEDLVKLETEYI